MHPLNLKPAFLALLAATAFSPWMVGAFDWPEKPTAEVKADLIAYAKSVGRAEFAAAIESQQDATSWMKAALEFGTARLKECEGADFRDLNRQIALRIIDYPLHVNNADMTMPGEERMAWCEAVRDYLGDAKDRVLAEVRSAKVEKGELRIWRIYNMAFVLKGPEHTVLVDLPALPYAGGRWSEKDRKAFAELADIFVLTHPHGDHYSEALVREFIAQGKSLVLPCDLHVFDRESRRNGPAYTTASCCHKLTEDHLDPLDIGGIKVWNFMGNQGVPCNVYLLEIDGVRVAHNGDNYDRGKEAMLAKCPPADVIIASTWNEVAHMVKSCSAAPGFDRGRAMFLPAHENELGHSVGHRESYREMYERKDRLGAKDAPWPSVHPLGFGESVIWRQREK